MDSQFEPSLSEVAADDEPAPLSRATLERWFRTTPAILHSVDAEGRLIAVSDAWLAKFGYRREEVVGRKSLDFLTPESRAYALAEVVSEFYRTGRRENIEYQMVCKDGRVLDVLLSAVLDPGDAEHGACSLAVITDVTDLRAAQRKLAESQALYEGIVEDQTDLVSLFKPEGALLFVNEAYVRVFGRRREDIVGANVLDTVPVHARDSVIEQMKRVCATHLPLESESQVVTASGRTRWIAWTSRAILGADNQVTAIHCVGRDIDRRVAAEERLKESEARYRLLAEHSSDMVMLVRSDGKRVYVSPACQNILGWSPDEAMAQTTQDSVHPDDLLGLQRSFAESQDAIMTFTYRLRRKDGAYIWVEAATQRVEIPGELPHRLLVVRDISERIESERLIKESEAKYRLLVDNSNDMVFQVDRDLVRNYVSPASRDILGYDPAELTGVKPLDQCHPDDAHLITEAARALLAGEAERWTVVNRSLHRAGHWVWVEAELRALKNPETGAICGIIGALRDISKRKAIEDQLADATRRLEILATEDALTGLANRRAFDEALDREYRRARREGGSLALIMIDVDRFKNFNDHYGHPAGDVCLKQVADAIGAAIRRPGDLAARYGGEEFVVLLPNTPEAGAAEIAERIRLSVRELKLENASGVDRVVTISAGVVASLGFEGAEPLLKFADRALYRAKDAGRDLVFNASWLPGDASDQEVTPRREVA